MGYLVSTFLVGVGATAVTDVWAIARKRLLGVAPPNYGLVGRWIAHMPRGRFRHDAIAAAEPVQGEGLIGWTAHYLIGIAFAAILPAVWGVEWFRHPTLGPALLVGIGTVAAPFLVLQPGMGAGLAARRTPHPAAARLHSLVMHAFFGLGLYLAGWATSHLYLP
ncbi:MAG: DUF2938 domain-containing protein [Novosphingobium sp.]